jgi:plasmid stabilization system protein ParE
MTRQIEWTRDAQNDFARIDQHYADIAPEFATKVGRIAIQTARYLAEHPGVGPKVDHDRQIQKWMVGQRRFLLFYRVKPDRIQILRVRHSHEDWQSQS